MIKSKGMKNFNIKFLVLTATASMALSSCSYTEEEVSQLEYYTRAFIKEYGIPDPDQDFNMAQNTDITVILDNPAKNVNVYVYAGSQYYRVAELTNVSAGTITIPMDVPEGSNIMVLTVDGAAYWAEPGSTIDTTLSSRSGKSREDATMTAKQIFGMEESEINALGWLVLVEDLGTTDDFDFNDVIFRIECVTVSVPINAKKWNAIDETQGEVVVSRSGESHNDGETTLSYQIKVTALAAGGTLPVFLHFMTKENVDYVLSPHISTTYGYTFNGYATAADITTKTDEIHLAEWHTWFTSSIQNPFIDTQDSDGYTFKMLNTYADGGSDGLTGGTVTLPIEWFTGDTFSMVNFSKATVDNNINLNVINGFFITVSAIAVDSDSRQYTVFANSRTPTVVAASTGTTIENEDTTYPKTPQMILLPDVGAASSYWKWPRERLNISSVYTNFSKWVSNSTGFNDWYLSTPVNEDVYSRY